MRSNFVPILKIKLYTSKEIKSSSDFISLNSIEYQKKSICFEVLYEILKFPCFLRGICVSLLNKNRTHRKPFTKKTLVKYDVNLNISSMKSTLQPTSSQNKMLS